MVLMTCGCRADGRLRDGRLVCSAHYGLNADAEKVAPLPDLTGREARCVHCGIQTASSIELPFFKYWPANIKDEYYCGCRVWD